LHPRARKAWNLRRRFLAQFVGRGDRVFDVGANIGEYSATFAELGAQPVAIEPAPDLQEALRRRLPGIPIEQVALSDRNGTADLLVGGGHVNSTLSTDYGEVLSGMGMELEPVTVSVTTLDALADKYGRPAFVKIDVEGHELAVLRGMNFDPPALSFEYHGSLLAEAGECVRLLAARGYSFRPVVGFDFAWATDEWLGADDLIAFVSGSEPATFGDVYCRV
jgi:FkbM family methyltransferase